MIDFRMDFILPCRSLVCMWWWICVHWLLISCGQLVLCRRLMSESF